MYVKEENKESLSEEICNFRDLLFKKNFEEEEIYSSFLMIGVLMYLSWSTSLVEAKKESLKVIEAAYREDIQRRYQDILKKAKISMKGTPRKEFYESFKNLYLIKISTVAILLRE